MTRRRWTAADLPPDDLIDGLDPNDRTAFLVGWLAAHRTPRKATRLLDQSAREAPRGAVRARGAAEALRTLSRCQACGERLTNPRSVARQTGPDCWASGFRPDLVEWADPQDDGTVLRPCCQDPECFRCAGAGTYRTRRWSA